MLELANVRPRSRYRRNEMLIAQRDSQANGVWCRSYYPPKWLWSRSGWVSAIQSLSGWLDFCRESFTPQGSRQSTWETLSYPFWLVGVHQTHLIAGHSSWRFDVFLRVRQFFVKRKYSITTPTKTHPTTPLFRTCRQLTLVGRPHLKTAEIHTTVEEHFHEMQMPVYKRRRRKSSQCSASDRQVRSLIFKSFFRCTVWRCLQTGCDWTANSDLRDWRHQFMKATNRATFNWGQCLRT